MTDFKWCDHYFKHSCPGDLPFKEDDVSGWDAAEDSDPWI